MCHRLFTGKKLKNCSQVVFHFWCYIVFSQCESDDPGLQWLKEVIADCAIKEHVSNVDVDEILAYKEATTYEGKCRSNLQ